MDFIKRFRLALNPPYRKKDSLIIIPVLFLLSAVPLTAIASLGYKGQTKAAFVPVVTREDEIKKLTLEIFKSKKSFSPSNLGRTKVLAKQRSELLSGLIEDSPEQVLKIAYSNKVRNTLPAEAKTYSEEEVALEGEVETYHTDNFTAGTSEYFYDLKTKSGKYELFFANSDPLIPTESKVRIKGIKVGRKVALYYKDLKVVSLPKVLPASTVKKVAVILMNFQNNTSEPWTQSFVKGVVFTNTGGVKAYHKEQSFNLLTMQGKASVDGEVFGWYTIPHSNTSCNYGTWSTAAYNAATAAGADLTGYTQIIYAFPSTSVCGWSGLAYISGVTSYINGSMTLRTVGHELGHNFGVHHSSSYTCTESGVKVPISNTCTSSEYGDPFDIMGGSTKHMNNFQKGRLGWFDPVNTLDVTAEGTYTLFPSSTSQTGPQAIRIPKDKDSLGNVTNYYYLEYRQPFGFDNFAATDPGVNGISIRIAPKYTTLSRPLLIDTVPSTGSFSDAPLAVNQTFTDAAKGITVKTLSKSAASASVQVNFPTPSCVRSAPGLTISPQSQWAAAGESKIYTLTLRNNDNSGCSSSSFQVSLVNASAGLTQSPNSYTETLAPGATAIRNITVTSSSSMAEGFYNFTNQAVHGSVSTFFSSIGAQYNIGSSCARSNPAISLNPTGQNGSAGTTLTYGVTLTNRDNSGCSVSVFQLSSAGPASWSTSLVSTTMNLAPGASGSTEVRVTSPSGSVADIYGFSLSATNTSVGSGSVGGIGTANGTYTVLGQKVGDLDGDTDVDIFDLSAIITLWKSGDAKADLNNNGQVDIYDLSILLNNWTG